MRFLIEQQGFRSLALEGDYEASFYLDTYVRTGEGDPQAILVRARSFLRFGEILDAVRWIRARNERNPGDQVRIVHLADLPREAKRLASGEDLERSLADAIIGWHERTRHRIVYWGGLAHTANGLATSKNAGSHLRARFGCGYVSIALTFHHGSLPSTVAVPPADYMEAVLGAVDQETFLMDIHDSRWPESVCEWLDAPVKTRLIGPGVHELHGRPLRIWLDLVIHSRCVTPARAL
jgi:erythromycin esterase